MTHGDRSASIIRANPRWQFGLIIASCVVGGALLIVGLWAEISVALDGILSTTFIVSGLALIFGAFGSQATVQYKGWVIAGVAAIALIFLFAIDYLRRDSFVIIELLTPKTPTTTIKAGNAIIKGTVNAEGTRLRTRFFVRYRDVNDTDLRFDIERPKKENESENSIVSICLTRDKLVRWFGRGGQLNWWLNEPSMEIFDNSRHLIGSRKDCGGDESSPFARLPHLGLSTAHAQGSPDIESLIQDLLSDNTDVRRLARDRLADLGTSVIRPLMDRAIKMTSLNDRLAFRMQVGAAVAIDNMISKGGRTVSPMEVRRELRDADFNAIIQWTLNRDQSLLGPALRILAATADLPTLQALMKVIENQKDENIIYNTAWILRQSAQRYRADPSTLAAIKQFARDLRPRSPGEKTINFLNQTEAM
jgi:hypothetical protein